MTKNRNGLQGIFIVAVTLIMFACAGINYPIHVSSIDDYTVNEHSYKDGTEVNLKNMFEKPIFMIDSGVTFSTTSNKIVKIVPHNESWQIINE